MSNACYRKGFSLLEMAVVLTVIAMIGGVGMTIASNALKAADRISTQERLNMIKIALDSHAKTYGYLPCPSDLAIASDDAEFGVEQRATVSTCTTTVGAVPVRSLNLPDSYAGDAWGNKFTYTTTATMVAGPTSWTTGIPGLTINYGPAGSEYVTTSQRSTVVVNSGVDDGSGNLRLTFASAIPVDTLVTLNAPPYKGSYWTKTAGTVTLLTTDAPGTTAYLAHSVDLAGTNTVEYQTTGTGAAYVVVSHGPNGLGAVPINGAAAAVPCGGTTRDESNCDGGADATSFYETDYNDNTDTAVNYFDDYLVWGSNESARVPVNHAVYTGTTETCPANTCEAWCAACEKNYPGTATGGSTNIPPNIAGDILNGGTIHTLCRKIISSNSTNCKAACFWSGVDSSGKYYPCP